MQKRGQGELPLTHIRGGSREELPTTEVRGGGQERQAATMHEGREEIPLIQGKEQWLHFVVAAMKRYPTSKVRETQVRQ